MHRLHPWRVDYREAVKIQRRLLGSVKVSSISREPYLVAGVDASIEPGSKRIYAAVVVLRWPQLLVVECVTSSRTVEFPYVPGLLSFREGPVLIEAFERIKSKVDLWFFDGQGLAHPRGLGIATHMGLWLDSPTIGCAKSRLVGSYREPGIKRGCYSKLVYKGKVVGVVLRTRSGVRPVFVSIGHKITLREAVEFVLAASPRYRIPEPIRQAHMVCSSLKG